MPAGAASFAQPAGAARGPLGQMPGGIQRPPGPPPRGGPVTAIKPPPMAPPPQMLQQTFQRPGVENVKAINSKKTPLSPKDVEEAPAKSPNFTVPKTAKEGAIAMFEEPDEASEPAEKKAKPTPEGPTSTADIKGPPRGPPRPMVPTADPSVPIMRQSKPTPPQANPPGIPEGQPLPPEVKPEVLKKPAPPIRPPPNRNRAPPNIDPEEEKRRRLAAAAAENAIRPPSSEPPLLRIKKAKEEPPMKRREKDMPEFEESDDEEEDPNFVKQPLPFGVLKEPLPKSSLAVEPPKQEPVLSPSQSVKSSISPSIKRVDDGASKSSAQTSRNDLPPPLAPVDTLTTELIPAAPAAMDKHYDDSKIGKSLTPGRLSIKVVEGYEIRRKDDLDRNPRNDPYLKFRLGAAERHPWKTSTVKRKQDTNPQFDDEIIFFDVLDPGQYIFQEDMQLVIELWNKSTMKDEKVGSVTMSVVRFLQKAFVSYVEKVPIYYPGAAKTTMKVRMIFIMIINRHRYS